MEDVRIGLEREIRYFGEVNWQTRRTLSRNSGNSMCSLVAKIRLRPRGLIEVSISLNFEQLQSKHKWTEMRTIYKLYQKSWDKLRTDTFNVVFSLTTWILGKSRDERGRWPGISIHVCCALASCVSAEESGSSMWAWLGGIGMAALGPATAGVPFWAVERS